MSLYKFPTTENYGAIETYVKIHFCKSILLTDRTMDTLLPQAYGGIYIQYKNRRPTQPTQNTLETLSAPYLILCYHKGPKESQRCSTTILCIAHNMAAQFTASSSNRVIHRYRQPRCRCRTAEYSVN